MQRTIARKAAIGRRDSRASGRGHMASGRRHMASGRHMVDGIFLFDGLPRFFETHHSCKKTRALGFKSQNGGKGSLGRMLFKKKKEKKKRKQACMKDCRRTGNGGGSRSSGAGRTRIGIGPGGAHVHRERVQERLIHSVWLVLALALSPRNLSARFR